MISIEDIAFALAVIGVINWLAGGIDFRGKRLILRAGYWRAMRWFGLIIFLVVSFLGYIIDYDPLALRWCELLASFALLFGSARKSTPN